MTSSCSAAREAEAPPRLVRAVAGSGGLEKLRRAVLTLRSMLGDSDDIEGWPRLRADFVFRSCLLPGWKQRTQARLFEREKYQRRTSSS